MLCPISGLLGVASDRNQVMFTDCTVEALPKLLNAKLYIYECVVATGIIKKKSSQGLAIYTADHSSGLPVSAEILEGRADLRNASRKWCRKIGAQH